MMSAKIMYPLANILAIPFIISLWLCVFSLPATNGGGQSDFYLVEAYTREHVQKLDQLATNPTYDPTDDDSGSFIDHQDAKSPIIHSQYQSNHEHPGPSSQVDVEFDDIGGGGASNVHAMKREISDSQSTHIDSDEASRKSFSVSSCAPTQAELDQQSANVNKFILTRELAKEACNLNRGVDRAKRALNSANKMTNLEGTYLRHCSRYKVGNLILSDVLLDVMHEDMSTCVKILEEFIRLDETIDIFDDLFIKLLSRYNCHNGYSVKWNCDDCKKAYKDWLCATHMPVYIGITEIKPCISFCERVEQRCPYLHPITREQYGGQPVFICRDPNIPFVSKITPDIPYSDPGKCYDLCHLNPNSTELTIDTLSKYDRCKCPSLQSIAQEVSPSTTPRTLDYIDYESQNDIKSGIDHETTATNNPQQENPQMKVYPHHKKLMELMEVLANYKNQSKTHRYHADHSSIEHSGSQTTDLRQMS